MLLRRLCVRNFRRFEFYEGVFGPGLNVILGNNEEGKSTLREAITLALFQDPKTNDKKVLALKRWGSPEQFRLDLQFEVDGARYLLSKDFQAKSSNLREVGTAEQMLDSKAIHARILEFVGLPSKAVFEGTARITQRDLTRLQTGGEVADLLQNAITGGADDVLASRVLEQLDVALKAQRSRARDNPGALATLPDRIASANGAISALGLRLKEFEEAQTTLTDKQAELEAAQQSLREKVALERDCRERLRLEDLSGGAREKEAALDKRVEQARILESSVAQAEAELAGQSGIAAVSAQQMARMAALEAQSQSILQLPPDETRLPSIRAPVIALGVLLVLAGALIGIGSSVFLLLCLPGAALLYWEMTRARRVAGVVELAAKMRAQERVEAVNRAAGELQLLLIEAGCSSVEELRAALGSLEQVRSRSSTDRAKLETLLDGYSLTALEEQRRAASAQVRRLADTLAEPNMRLAAVDQLGYQRLTADIQALQDEAAALQQEIERLRVVVLSSRVALGDLYALEEQREEMQRALAGAEERRQVLTVARMVIDEARQAVMLSAQALLQRELGEFVRDITGGRYSSVLVDPATLSLRLQTAHRAEPVDVVLDGDLSTGTVDQVYIAARLVLVRLLSGDRRPPIILDDPFVTFDPIRRAAVLAACQRLSAHHQMLLFTCHEGYETVADNLIRLPGLA